MDIIRYKGKWYKISKKPYEPETQTIQVAWRQIRDRNTPEEAYRKFFENQREEARILYPSFRKDKDVD
jgi:hypothetical protein